MKRRDSTAMAKAAAERKHHSLSAALRAGKGRAIIAEAKKASPSAGLISSNYDPARLAAGYEAGGASGISVLTEPRHFLGSPDDLRAVRAVTSLPVLRKDFICDPYQVLETCALGADVLLLIVAMLDRDLLLEINREALRTGLEVLVEAHTADEVDFALGVEGAIVGVNSRDLKSLKTDLRVAEQLAKRIPGGRPAVAESGIKTREDIARLADAGYSGFLVGEALAGAADPVQALRRLLS